MSFVQLHLRASSGSEDENGPESAPGLGDKRELVPARARISPSLVARIRERDVYAFRELIQTTSSALVRYCRSIVGSVDDAEDIVQNVYIAVWELADQWQPVGDPLAYLFASVRNRALDELRRSARAERREIRAQAGIPELTNVRHPGESRTILQQVIDAEDSAVRIQQVADVLATLNERQRTAYELRYRQGLPLAVVAETLGVSLTAAESLVARLTRTLIDRLRPL